MGNIAWLSNDQGNYNGIRGMKSLPYERENFSLDRERGISQATFY